MDGKEEGRGGGGTLPMASLRAGVSTLRRGSKGGKGMYMALSKNMTTPPVKKKPPAGVRSAAVRAPAVEGASVPTA